MTEEIIKEEFDKAFKKNFPDAIIIDGVDVAGCPDIKQYNDTEGNMMCMEYIDGSCEGHNCFFKQLKRLEQENKELKKQIESDKGLITVGGKQQYEYLQRIDELEQENKTLQAYKDINEDFKQAWYELNEKYKQLRSALEEIRRYAEERCRQKVLDKINEVLYLS